MPQVIVLTAVSARNAELAEAARTSSGQSRRSGIRLIWYARLPSISRGAEVPAFYAYLQDRQNGATLETVAGGHTLSLIEVLVGAYVEVDARTSTLRLPVRISGTDVFVNRACADHMLVLGRHEGGCVSTLGIIGGIGGTPFELMLEGERCWIKLIGGERGRVPVVCQAGPLVSGLKGGAINVGESYARLVHGLRLGRKAVSDFDDAVRLTRLIEAIDRASLDGRQQL